MDWSAALAVAPATVAAAASLIASLRNGQRITVVHEMVNSRLSELLEMAKKDSYAAGHAAGGATERNRGEQAALTLIDHDRKEV